MSHGDSSGFFVCLPGPDALCVSGQVSAHEWDGGSECVPCVCHGDSVYMLEVELTSLSLGEGVKQQRHWLVRSILHHLHIEYKDPSAFFLSLPEAPDPCQHGLRLPPFLLLPWAGCPSIPQHPLLWWTLPQLHQATSVPPNPPQRHPLPPPSPPPQVQSNPDKSNYS